MAIVSTGRSPMAAPVSSSEPSAIGILKRPASRGAFVLSGELYILIPQAYECADGPFMSREQRC